MNRKLVEVIMLMPGCRSALFVVALTFIASCSPPTATQVPSGTPKPPPPPATTSHTGGEPKTANNAVTTEQAEAIAAKMQSAVAAADTASFAAEFDFPALVASVLSGIEGNNPEAHQLRASFGKQLDTIRTQLVNQIFQQVAAGGSYHYIRTIQREEGPRPIFRLHTAEGGLNYHELVLATRPEGVRVVDLFIYLSGERLTESMLHVLLTGLPPDKQTLFASFSGSAKASLQRIVPFTKMMTAFQSGDHESALAIYDSLSPSLRKDKEIQRIRIMAAQKGDPAKYTAAIDEFRADFPHDPSIDLISLDSHMLSKRFDEVHGALDRLDKKLGGDPYLQVKHANAYIAEGKLEQAEKIAEQMLATDPRNLDAHWVLVSRSLAAKDFENTFVLLKKIRGELGIPIKDLTKIPAYAEFVASPAYEKWKSGN